MASSHNVELEAAKFLQKLIQDSKDEPAKLATKLYVILQHMKASGKEHSMPYQVISRAMETVISQNGLDLESLKTTLVTGGSQVGNSQPAQLAGTSQAVGIDSRSGLAENEMSRIDQFTSSRPPVGPSSGSHNYYQGAGPHRSSQAFEHESPSSFDTRSANSQSQERHDASNLDKQANQKEGRKVTSKRKRGDSSMSSEPQSENIHQFDAPATLVNTRKGKINKVEMQGSFPLKTGENPTSNMVPIGGMQSMFRAKQKVHTSNVTENTIDSLEFSNSMLRAPNSEYPEDVEASSTHNVAGLQQGGSISAAHEVSSRGVWNQNKAVSSQVPRFSSSDVSGAFGKAHGGLQTSSNPYLTREVGFSGPMHFGCPGSMGLPEKSVEAQFSANQGDEASRIPSTGRVLEHDGGNSGIFDASRMAQGGRQSSVSGMAMARTAGGSRDSGKSVPPNPALSNTPFIDHQLKQLRAQCLVFLAFRNGLMPKKLHLEIALGSISPKEGTGHGLAEPSSSAEVTVPRLNTTREADKNPQVIVSSGRFPDCDSLKEAENSKPAEKTGLSLRKPEADLQSQEAIERQQFLTSVQQSDPARLDFSVRNPVDDIDDCQSQFGRASYTSSVIGVNKQTNSEMISWTGIANHNGVPMGILTAASDQHESLTERKDTASGQFQSPGCISGNPTETHLSSFSLREPAKAVSGIVNDHNTAFQIRDASMMAKHLSQADAPKFSMEKDGADKSVYADATPPPKYTMSEKWIMDHQKKKFLVEQNWLQKQQKAKRKISATFQKLKVNVSSSEDISAKTKSVIELKKLHLLELQRRTRSDFLNDFFKPVATDMERLKSFKKHKHGRRIKQLEKFELKMKEERQKRIHERQKVFFSEIEAHREKQEDVFKIKRERYKGFNKYVKEFHKRKERFHREKIDRIQREKINLLKINDVEGYLRMVQDAKSDRVKQLLKVTEKYLQKLGSKLQEAKAVASRFEDDGDDVRMENAVEKNENVVDNDDETDQAKHYMESNEKYYTMAHSIKESIADQPACLHGGKLREYQMNGLRWLVSLYNNKLNGILADEMGLGKTVQVISLICYLMETKNDRGPFLVVVPSSVLPGWESEINFWAPGIHKIVYSGPPEDRRRLFKEQIVQQKFNVLLTTYEYLMNKHDRPKLSKIHWHYVIIDEGHRIKNASCKLNADLKHYRSYHRLLLTGTPLQNNLEELWALLNFLLPSIFNSSEDFSQWFNKPFESNGDNSADEALLSEEENLLIINRLHQVLRPFVLRRLKHKVENELPEKIERLIRCEASAYQKLLMKRVEENLGSIGSSKVRSVHNSVMELRNICNHPYLSHLHAEEVDNFVPKHYLPPIIRLCGKLEMLDRILPKLKVTGHRVLFFSTMTRLLDVMEEYLTLKQYRYLRLDGHTSGQDRGALIDMFNQQDSPFFIFLLSIRAGGVGVNLQAADTVILFDTDWNPQVDLQAQARAHRIGQKRDVLVLRFETVQTVEEQVRASAEHKLGVANQSITAGFFDNNTSAEDRKEYLESLLRECKKEETAPVLDDDALNDILARSESEIDIFESVDKQRREQELAIWEKLEAAPGMGSGNPPLLPSRLVTDNDLKEFCEAMKIYEVPKAQVVSNVGEKRKRGYLGGPDTQLYGRGKRSREVRSYEEQWTEEEFEKMCQAEDAPESPKDKEEPGETKLPTESRGSVVATVSSTEPPAPPLVLPPPPPPALPLAPPPALPLAPPLALPLAPPLALPLAPPLALPLAPPLALPPPSSVLQLQSKTETHTPPSKRGRGRPRRTTVDKSPATPVASAYSGIGRMDTSSQQGNFSTPPMISATDSTPGSTSVETTNGVVGPQASLEDTPSPQPMTSSQSVPPGFGTSVSQLTPGYPDVPMQSRGRGRGRKTKSSAPTPRRKEKKQEFTITIGSDGLASHDFKLNEQSQNIATSPVGSQAIAMSGIAAGTSVIQSSEPLQTFSAQPVGEGISETLGTTLNSPLNSPLQSVANVPQSSTLSPALPPQPKGQSRKTQGETGTPRRRGKKQALAALAVQSESKQQFQENSGDPLVGKDTTITTNKENCTQELANTVQNQTSQGQASLTVVSNQQPDFSVQHKLPTSSSTVDDQTGSFHGTSSTQAQSADKQDVASVAGKIYPEAKTLELQNVDVAASSTVSAEVNNDQNPGNKAQSAVPILYPGSLIGSVPGSAAQDSGSNTMQHVAMKTTTSPRSISFSVVPGSQPNAPSLPEPIQTKRHGRKTPVRAEVTRRRGKKQGPVAPPVSGDSANQDPNPQAQNLGNRAMAQGSKQQPDTQKLATQHASEVHSPGALSGQDLRRKETFVNPPSGRFQTGDINDVARVMKEIFSETHSPMPKTGEGSGNEGNNASTLPALSMTSSCPVIDQESEDKIIVAVPASATTTQVTTIKDANEPKGTVPRTDCLESGSNNAAVSARGLTDSMQLSKEISTVESNMEIVCAIAHSSGQKEGISLTGDDLSGLKTVCSTTQVATALTSADTTEPSVTAPNASPTVSQKPNNAGDRPTVASSVLSRGPSLKETPRSRFVICGLEATTSLIKVLGGGNTSAATVANSGNANKRSSKPSPSKQSPKILLGSKSIEALNDTPRAARDVDYHSKETGHNSATMDVQGSVGPPPGFTNPATRDVQGSVGPPPGFTNVKAAKHGARTIDEVPEVPNLTTGCDSALKPVTIALPGCSTATLHEEKIEDSSNGDEDKKNIGKSLRSIDADPSNILLVSDNRGELQPPAGFGRLKRHSEPGGLSPKVSSEGTSKVELTEKQPRITEIQLGKEKAKNNEPVNEELVAEDCAQACNMEVETSDPQAFSTKSLADSDKQDPSAMKEEEMVSKNVQVESTVALEEPKESDVDVGDQMDVTQVVGEGSIGVLSNRSPDRSIVSPETCDQMDLSQAEDIVPENTPKNTSSSPVAENTKIEGSSENNPDIGLGEQEESKQHEINIHEKFVETKATETAVQNETEKPVLPSSSLATDEEMVDGSLDNKAPEEMKTDITSEQDPAIGQQQSEGSALVPDFLDVDRLGEAPEEMKTDITSEKDPAIGQQQSEGSALDPDSLDVDRLGEAPEEMKTDITSEKDPAIGQQQSEGSALDPDSLDVDRLGERIQENYEPSTSLAIESNVEDMSQKGCLVITVKDSMENMEVTEHSTTKAMEEENIEDRSKINPAGSLVGPQVTAIVQEEEEKNIDDLAGSGSVVSSVAVEDPKSSETARLEDIPLADNDVKNVAENDRSSSPSEINGEKIKVSPEDSISRSSYLAKTESGNPENMPQMSETLPDNAMEKKSQTSQTEENVGDTTNTSTDEILPTVSSPSSSVPNLENVPQGSETQPDNAVKNSQTLQTEENIGDTTNTSTDEILPTVSLLSSSMPNPENIPQGSETQSDNAVEKNSQTSLTEENVGDTTNTSTDEVLPTVSLPPSSVPTNDTKADDKATTSGDYYPTNQL